LHEVVSVEVIEDFEVFFIAFVISLPGCAPFQSRSEAVSGLE